MCGKLSYHLGLAEGNDPHPMKKGDYSPVEPWVCRRVSCLKCYRLSLSDTSYRCLAVATTSHKQLEFSSAISRGYRVSASLPSRMVILYKAFYIFGSRA
jgi:hypothetical protein